MIYRDSFWSAVTILGTCLGSLTCDADHCCLCLRSRGGFGFGLRYFDCFCVWLVGLSELDLGCCVRGPPVPEGTFALPDLREFIPWL